MSTVLDPARHAHADSADAATGGLLAGKRLLVTGVLTEASLAFHIAKLAQEQGAEVVLTSFGRAMRITSTVARRLPSACPVLELDVTSDADAHAVAKNLGERWDGLDGVVHAVAFAPAACLGGDILQADWDDVAPALDASAFSLKRIAEHLLPLLAAAKGSIIGLDFDASVAWPQYDWMGVAKAALESTARYLARDLGPHGIRVNLVAAGPIRTVASQAIPGFDQFEETWCRRAPLGWAVSDPSPVAKACVALLSDWFGATTGEIVHVDGGFHAIGA